MTAGTLRVFLPAFVLLAALSASEAPDPLKFSLSVKGLAEAAKEHRNPGVLALAAGQPVELHVSVINSAKRGRQAKVQVRVITFAGNEVWTEELVQSFPPGRTEMVYRIFDKPGAPQEGQFLAQVLSASSTKSRTDRQSVPPKELANLVFGYFPDFQEIAEKPDAPILVLRDRKVVGRIKAERVWPKLPDYTRLDPILGQASDGALYAMFQENHYAEDGDTRAQRPTFVSSTDGGRTWKLRQVTLDPPAGNRIAVRAFGVTDEDHLFVAYSPALPDAGDSNLSHLRVARSTDRGKTWSNGVQVDISNYVRVQGLGRFYQGMAGEIWFNATLLGADKRELERSYDGLFRSRDGGKTWGDVSLNIPSSAECQLLRLASGRWLSTIRTSGRPGDTIGPDGKPMNLLGIQKLATYDKTATHFNAPFSVMFKRTFLAESDHGREWGNVRQLTSIIGDTPGELIQLPDGRVVFLYCRRYKPRDGVYARISHDQGRTWQPELLALRTAGGYSSSVVQEDGTIVSMLCWETIQAVRWQLPEQLAARRDESGDPSTLVKKPNSAEPPSQIHFLKTSTGVRFGLLGRKPPVPAATVFIFGNTIENNFSGIEIVPIVKRRGWLCVSLDSPLCGQNRNREPGEPADGLEAWRARIEAKDNFIPRFNRKVADVLDYLIAEGYTATDRVAVLGGSLGGFLAYHYAASDPRIKCAGGSFPLTDLGMMSEFNGMENDPLTRSLALVNQAGKFASRHFLLIIGDDDNRVGTDLAIAFARQVTRKSPKVNVQLHVLHARGHREPEGTLELTEAWLTKHLRGSK